MCCGWDVDIPWTSRGNAATGTWIFRGDESSGTNVWPAAAPLLSHVVDLIPSIRDGLEIDRPLRVLELGSGCGLVGLGLAAATASRVLLTEAPFSLGGDGDETSFDWLRSNVDANCDAVEAAGGGVDVAVLAWGDAGDHAAVAAAYPDGFDLVVGSDLLYVCRVGISLINRGVAAAATWIFRGDEALAT